MAGTVLPTWLILLVGIVVMGSLLLVCAWSDIKRCFTRIFSSRNRAPDTLDSTTPLLNREHQTSDHVTLTVQQQQQHQYQQHQLQQQQSQQQQYQQYNQRGNYNNSRDNNYYIPAKPASILKTSINHPNNQLNNNHHQPHHQLNSRNPNQPRTQEQLTQHQKRLAARLQEHYANSSVQGTTTYQSTIDHQSVQAFHDEQGDIELSIEGSMGSLSSGAFSEGDIPSDDDDNDSDEIRQDHVIAFDTTSTLLETMSALNSDVGYLSDGDVDLAAEITGYEVDESDDDQSLQPTNPESILDAQQSREKHRQQEKQRQRILHHQTQPNVALSSSMSQTQVNTHHNAVGSSQQHYQQFQSSQQNNPQLHRKSSTNPTTIHQVVDLSPDNENIIPRQVNLTSSNNPNSNRPHYTLDDTHSTHISLNNSLNDRVVASGSIVMDQKHTLYHHHRTQHGAAYSGNNHSGGSGGANNNSSGNNPLSNHTPTGQRGSITKDRSSTTRNYHHSTNPNSPGDDYHMNYSQQPEQQQHQHQHQQRKNDFNTSGSISGSNKQAKKVTINPKVATFTNKTKNDFGFSRFDEDNMFGDLSDTSSVYTVNTVSSKNK